MIKFLFSSTHWRFKSIRWSSCRWLWNRKKVNVIGSIAQIGSDRLENRSTPQLSNALTGQMSGVTVIQRSGRPGDSSGQIRVRGVAFGATPDALVLVDGLPGSLNDINPEGCRKVYLYWKMPQLQLSTEPRAANGVVLVTTKGGKEGNDH